MNRADPHYHFLKWVEATARNVNQAEGLRGAAIQEAFDCGAPVASIASAAKMSESAVYEFLRHDTLSRP